MHVWRNVALVCEVVVGGGLRWSYSPTKSTAGLSVTKATKQQCTCGAFQGIIREGSAPAAAAGAAAAASRCSCSSNSRIVPLHMDMNLQGPLDMDMEMQGPSCAIPMKLTYTVFHANALAHEHDQQKA
jgi:hypothetical protein